MMAMALTANAQDMTLELGTLTIEDGIGMMDVSLASSYDVVGWEMTLSTPEGLVPAGGDLNDRYEYNKIKKSYYHSVEFTKNAEGNYLGICYALDAKHNAISGQEGVLATILFDAEGYTGKAEDATITIEKFSISLSSGEQINYEGDKVSTGIEFITRSMNPNGNGAIYNLSGQRVEKASKGLYIKNGQKVVVK